MEVGIAAECDALLLVGVRDCGGEIPRVDDDSKVRAGGRFVVGVDVGVETLAEVSAESGGKMATGGEAENADMAWIDVEICGVRADEGECALGVFKGFVRFWIRTRVGNAVFENQTGNVEAVEPLADLGTFEVDGENAIAASREDNDGGAGGVRCGLINRERWNGDVAEADYGATGDEVVFGRGGVGFGGR